MTSPDFVSWLTTWTKEHPLRRTAASRQATYVQEVMARIEEASASQPHAAPWDFGWRALAGLAAAAACALLVLAVLPRAPGRVAQRIDRDWQVLAAVGETDAVTPELDDAQAHDLLQLAEADSTTSNQSVEETLKLLEELDAAGVDAGDASTDSLLEELQGLDELDLAT